eukprot:48288-Prorocentrum_minimum.AAC.2
MFEMFGPPPDPSKTPVTPRCCACRGGRVAPCCCACRGGVTRATRPPPPPGAPSPPSPRLATRRAC